MKPFEVLGNAATYKELRTALGFTDGLYNDSTFDWEVRESASNRNVVETGMTTHWHQDARGDGAIVLWSDTYPTEVKLPDGSIGRGKPGDVVMIDNEACFHRVPENYVDDVKAGVDKPRWFARLILHTPWQIQSARHRLLTNLGKEQAA